MRNPKIYVISILSFICWLPGCWATCYKITAVNNNPSNNYYTEPGMGDVVNWGNAGDTVGSAGTIAGNINLAANTQLDSGETFVPDNTILASGSIRFTEMGTTPYTPETILFRCTADEEGKLYEYYSVNGDDTYSGNVDVGKNTGHSETYQTAFSGVASRLTNLATGEYYSRYWKSRPLLNLDHDSLGWILVKAKNFSDAKIELLKNSYAKGNIASGNYTRTQPLAYIAFHGGGFSPQLYDGADHASNHSGWASHWPAVINLYNRVSLTKINTCKLTYTTPSVFFPPIAVPQLMQNQKLTQPIDIDFVCQSTESSGGYTGFKSGIEPGKTAMGFVINAENAAAAREEGLEYRPDMFSHLLADGYKKNADVATGVGIRITSDGGRDNVDLFTNINAPGNMNGPWYPVLFNAANAGRDNTLTNYKARFYATLERLPGKQATAGYFRASMQVVIKVL